MDRIQKVREEIRGCLQYIEGLAIDSTECERFLEELKGELERRRRAFETHRFFVVTVGALKSGKSTLINSLVGQRVSPDGIGAETTKKCSVIMSADNEHPEGITLYRAPNYTTNSQKKEGWERESEKLTSTLMEYFKGIREWDGELTKLFERKTIPLHGKGMDPAGEKDNLEYVLTSEELGGLQQFRDFFLAEIRVKVEEKNQTILNHGGHKIAIVDMPGLDGILAGASATYVGSAHNPVNFLPKSCHLFLLVQSSISGLNRSTADTLKSWRTEKRRTPVYLVFNTIEAKSGWYAKNAVLTENQESEKRAQKESLSRGIRYNNFFSINAAKGWESLHATEYKRRWQEEYKEPKLWEDSQVQVLEDALCEAFDKQLENIIQEDAMDGIAYGMEEFQNHLNDLEAKTKSKRQALNQFQECWNQVMQCVEEVSLGVPREEIIELAGKEWDKTLKTEEINDAKNKAQKTTMVRRLRDAVNEGVKQPRKTEDFCEEMEVMSKNIEKAVNMIHMENDFVKVLNDLLKEKYEDFYGRLNTQLGNLEGEKGVVSMKEVKEVKESIQRFSTWKDATAELREVFPQIHPDQWLERRRYKGFIFGPWFKDGKKKRREDFIVKCEREYEILYSSSIKEKMIDYCVASDEKGDSLLNRRINVVKEHLEKDWESRGQVLAKNLSQADEILRTIPELRRRIEQIRDDCSS